MADATDRPDSFLRRWSQRKLASAREAEAPPLAPPPVDRVAAEMAPAPVAPPADTPAPAPNPGDPPLPDVESLTFDSDFRAVL
jgi:cell division septation protein DedD